jgi:hypothetical protein
MWLSGLLEHQVHGYYRPLSRKQNVKFPFVAKVGHSASKQHISSDPTFYLFAHFCLEAKLVLHLLVVFGFLDSQLDLEGVDISA